MKIRDGFIGTVGDTPMIKLRRASEETGCTILGKAEFLNPGGSVKDRAALFIIKDAEERGLLRRGGVVVEGTAGNTGIGLCACWQRPRLPPRHRHARDAEQGKEGHATLVRRRSASRCVSAHPLPHFLIRER